MFHHFKKEASILYQHLLKGLLQGVHYTYRDDSAPVLTAASNEQVTLILPEHMKVKHGAQGPAWGHEVTSLE